MNKSVEELIAAAVAAGTLQQLLTVGMALAREGFLQEWSSGTTVRKVERALQSAKISEVL